VNNILTCEDVPSVYLRDELDQNFSSMRWHGAAFVKVWSFLCVREGGLKEPALSFDLEVRNRSNGSYRISACHFV